MNVLFIGNWDLVGSGFANRLLREGHSVSWMTEEPQQTLWNQRFHGNVYRGRFRQEEMLHILKSQMIDTVVFLTAPLREVSEENHGYESQIRTLSRVLAGMKEFPVKTFLYCSSIELEYQDKATPMLSDLVAGEMYCESYRQNFDLPLLTVRLGYLYGDVALEQMPFVGSALKAVLDKKTISSQFGEDDYIDAIHVEDAAFAMYQLVLLRKTGTYRLTTGHPVTMKQFYRCLGEAAGQEPLVEWIGQHHTADAEHFRVDELKLQTGWIPFYLLPEKGISVLKNCAERYRQSWKQEEKKLSQQQRLIPFAKVFAPGTMLRSLVETLLLFLLSQCLLKFSQSSPDLKYVDVRLLFVALTACFYGTEMGAVAVVLASVSYLLSLSSSFVDTSYLIYSVDTWIPFVTYIVAGIVIGNVTNRSREQLQFQKNSYNQLEKKYEFLQTIQAETLDIKGKLQRQLASSRHSFGDMYRVVLELDSLRPELVLSKVIGILQDILSCDKAAVYRFGSQQSQFLRLVACSPTLEGEVSGSMELAQYPKLREALREDGLYVNTDLIPGYPDFAARIQYRGVHYGMVAVYDIGYDKFTMYYQNLFKVLIGLVENSLIKALEYESSQAEKLYVPGTELLNPQAFAEKLAFMQEQQEGGFSRYTLAQVTPEKDYTAGQVSESLGSLIRISDYMGQDEDGKYWVILTNTLPEQVEGLQQRFAKKGLRVEVPVR